MVKTRMEELDRQRCMVVIIDELEEGVPVEPLEPSFDLTMHEFRGNEMDSVVYQATQNFMSDDSFVKSRAFLQFLWKRNLPLFESQCKKKKAEQPHLGAPAIEEEVKEELLQ